MLFAWQGFSVEHPEDWAPIALTGNRKEGYARIADAGQKALQIRWRPARNSNPRQAVDRYLDVLSKDSQKKGQSFSRDVDEQNGSISYRYGGLLSGRGTLFSGCEGSKLFFLEMVGGRKDSLTALFRQFLESFRTSDGDDERWALHGLDVCLPKGLTIEGQELKSGKTSLRFGSRGVSISAERWGLAEQLLAKHSLLDWAASVTNLPLTKVDLDQSEEGIGMTYRRGLFPPVYALAMLQADRNQLTVIRSETRLEKFKPRWTWFS